MAMKSASPNVLEPLRPFRRKNRSEYVVQFKHPAIGKYVSRGLGTESIQEAELLCIEIKGLCDWGIPLEQKTFDTETIDILAKFNPKSISAYFGKNHPVQKARDSYIQRLMETRPLSAMIPTINKYHEERILSKLPWAVELENGLIVCRAADRKIAVMSAKSYKNAKVVKIKT